MPAEKKVSVGWQIVFTFIPIADLWAFYRVRKLRRYLLYVCVPAMVLGIIDVYYEINTLSDQIIFASKPAFATESENVETQFGQSDLFGPPMTSEEWQSFLAYQLSTAALQGFSIFLVIIWSSQHNRQYDQPTVQPAK